MNALIARVCHEVNRAYCIAIGDVSQPDWANAPEWQKRSAIAGVEAHMKNDLTPQESHRLWCEEKLREGWSWGITKDVEQKKHPCLVPYDQLPLEQRIKDYLFTAVVQAFKDASTKGGDPGEVQEGW